MLPGSCPSRSRGSSGRAAARRETRWSCRPRERGEDGEGTPGRGGGGARGLPGRGYLLAPLGSVLPAVAVASGSPHPSQAGRVGRRFGRRWRLDTPARGRYRYRCGSFSLFPASPGPASKVEAEPAAEGWLEGGGGREEGRGGRRGQSPSGGAGTARAWGRGRGHPPPTPHPPTPTGGGGGQSHSPRSPLSPGAGPSARPGPPVPPPFSPPPSPDPASRSSRPAPSGRRRCPGGNPARAGLWRSRTTPPHTHTTTNPPPVKAGVKPDVAGGGETAGGGGGEEGGTDPPVEAALPGPSCKRENWRLLGSKTGLDRPPVIGSSDGPGPPPTPPAGEGHPPTPPGPGQSGAATRRDGGTEPGAEVRLHVPPVRPPGAGPDRLCPGAEVPFRSPGNGGATPAGGGGGGGGSGLSLSPPAVSHRERTGGHSRVHAPTPGGGVARAPVHTPPREHPPSPVHTQERSHRCTHVVGHTRPDARTAPHTQPWIPTPTQDTPVLPSLLHTPVPPPPPPRPPALPRFGGFRSTPGAASSYLAPVKRQKNETNRRARA